MHRKQSHSDYCVLFSTFHRALEPNVSVPTHESNPERETPRSPDEHDPVSLSPDEALALARELKRHAPDPSTARQTLFPWQKAKYAAIAFLLVLFVAFDYKYAFSAITMALGLFYLAVVGARILAALLAWRKSYDLRATPEEIAAIPADEWPVYTILAPLYREANVAGSLLAALRHLDYPADKLDVKLLLEEDDDETRDAIANCRLPPHCEIIVVPAGKPQTKPRACNVGLARARGDIVVIFDAEDRPEPDQLKQAAALFRRLPEEIVCIQAKLNYYNAGQNVLTRCFALEYATWFDFFLPGLYRIGFPIPLGGTSNHFRASALRELGGWDAWNVTEDCDLGIRIARAGWRTAVLDSTTWEEATSRVPSWVRQRSRWVKGYWQTHFVHARAWPADAESGGRKRTALRELGLWKYLGFLLTVGGLAGTLFLNPLFWVMMFGVMVYAYLWGSWPEPFFYLDYTNADQVAYTAWSQASWVFFALSCILFAANLGLVGLHLLACRRPHLRKFWPYAFLAPFYWLLMSVGAWKGTLQLLWKPSYWEKTDHGNAIVDAPPDGGGDVSDIPI